MGIFRSEAAPRRPTPNTEVASESESPVKMFWGNSAILALCRNQVNFLRG